MAGSIAKFLSSMAPAVFLVAEGMAQSVDIHWYSSADQTNLTSASQPFDGRFNFELGVFNAGFTPTLANQSLWLANWHPAAPRSAYLTGAKRYDVTSTVPPNAAPFLIGAPTYVWCFRGGTTTSEWLLFRHASWTWPNGSPSGPPPFPLEWKAEDATAVLGTIHSSGTPFLMQSAAVSGLVSPPTSWAQWGAVELVGTGLNGPADDADGDGVKNLMEYVFGLPPQQAGPPPVTPVTLAGGYLQITVPRRKDHVSATLTVEVSADLVHWYSGGGQTVEVSDTPAAWVVRDATPYSSAAPRFMRVKATMP